jgi:hypothetical protein
MSKNPKILIIRPLGTAVKDEFCFLPEELHHWNREISGPCSRSPPRMAVHQMLWYILTPCLTLHQMLWYILTPCLTLHQMLWYILTPCLTLHQLFPLQRLQKTWKRTLMPPEPAAEEDIQVEYDDSD